MAVDPAHARRGRTARDQRSTPLLVPAESGRRQCGRDAPDEARALIIDVVQRRLARLDDLSHWIEARRPNGKVVLRRALAEAAAGAWSLPEADLARLMSRSSVVPEPWLNPELRDADGCRLTTPDLWFGRCRDGGDGAQPEVSHWRPRLGGHGRTRLGPLGDSVSSSSVSRPALRARPGAGARSGSNRLRHRSPLRSARGCRGHAADRLRGAGFRSRLRVDEPSTGDARDACSTVGRVRRGGRATGRGRPRIPSRPAFPHR